MLPNGGDEGKRTDVPIGPFKILEPQDQEIWLLHVI